MLFFSIISSIKQDHIHIIRFYISMVGTDYFIYGFILEKEKLLLHSKLAHILYQFITSLLKNLINFNFKWNSSIIKIWNFFLVYFLTFTYRSIQISLYPSQSAQCKTIGPRPWRLADGTNIRHHCLFFIIVFFRNIPYLLPVLLFIFFNDRDTRN